MARRGRGRGWFNDQVNIGDKLDLTWSSDFNLSGKTVSIDEDIGANQEILDFGSNPIWSQTSPWEANGNSTYAIVGGDSSHFELNTSNGKLKLKNNPDYETDPNFTISIKVTRPLKRNDNRIYRTHANTETFEIIVNDIPENQPPVFTSLPTANAIDENTATSTIIYSAAGTDESAISWSLKEEFDYSKFSIDSIGNVSLASSPDYELDGNELKFTVRASDGTFTTDQTVTLDINDVFENELVLYNKNETETDKTLSQSDNRLFDIKHLEGFDTNDYSVRIPWKLRSTIKYQDDETDADFGWITLQDGKSQSDLKKGVFRVRVKSEDGTVKHALKFKIKPENDTLSIQEQAVNKLNSWNLSHTSKTWTRTGTDKEWSQINNVDSAVDNIFNKFQFNTDQQENDVLDKFKKGTAKIAANTNKMLILDTSNKNDESTNTDQAADVLINESTITGLTDARKEQIRGILNFDESTIIDAPIGELDFSVDTIANGTAVVKMILEEEDQDINRIIKTNIDGDSFLYNSQIITYEGEEADFDSWLDNLDYSLSYYKDPAADDVGGVKGDFTDVTLKYDGNIVEAFGKAGIISHITLGDHTPYIDGSAYLIDKDGDGDIEMVSAFLIDQGFFDTDRNEGLIRDPIIFIDLPEPGAPGIDGSGNRLFSDQTPNFSGTTDVAGNIIKVFAEDGTTLLATTTAGSDNTWSISDGDYYGAIIADGDHTLKVKAFDPTTDVPSEAVDFNITIDTTAPTITSASSIDFLENGTGTVVALTADESISSWTLGGADAALFTFDGSGNLSFNASPDYGVMKDVNRDNDYELSISATDAAGNTSTQELTVTVTDDTTETFTGMVDTALTYNYRLQRSGIVDDPLTDGIDESDQDITGVLGFSNDVASTLFESETVTGLGTRYDLIIEAKVSGDSTSEKTVNLETFDTTFDFGGLFKHDESTTVTFGSEINSATSSQLIDLSLNEGLIRATGATLDKLNEDSGDIGISSAQSAFTELFTISGLTLDETKAKAIGDKQGITFTADTNIYETVMSVRTNDNAEIKSLNELEQLSSAHTIDAIDNVTIHEAYSEFKEQGTTLYTTRTIGASVNTALIRDGSVVNAISRLINDGTFETEVDKINLNQVGANSNFKIMIDDNAGESYPYAELDTGSLTFDSILSDSYKSGYVTGDVVDGNSIYQSSSDGNSGWIGEDGGDIEIKFKVKVDGAVGQTLGDLDTGFFQISGDDVRTTTSKADGSTISDNLITFQGDINYDGRVSLKDLAFLNAGALNEGDGYAADDVDANYDGTISTKDLAIIDRDWGGNLHGISSLDTLISEDNWAEISNKGGKTFGAVSDVGSFDNSVWEKEATLNNPTLMADPLAGDIYSGEGNLYTGSNLYADDTKDFGTGSDPITGYDPS